MRGIYEKIIIICIIVVLILIIPIPTGKARDGGTKTYTALTYKIVVWHHFCDDDKVFAETKVYFFPSNYLSLDELFERELNR